MLNPDRFFSPEASQRQAARRLYESVKDLPLVCPHGHVDPRIFADPEYRFASPSELLIIPDHYVFRMLHSMGIPLEALGVPRADSGAVEEDPRKIWQLFAENYMLFRGTPTGIWLQDEFVSLFRIEEKLNGENAQDIYDQIEAIIQSPEFTPRALYERFNIETLCTTDTATDSLEYHQAIQESGWNGRIVPTFRPDAVVNIDHPDWLEQIEALTRASGIEVVDYPSYIRAIENRREYFKSMGAKATDHAAYTADTQELSQAEVGTIFNCALKCEVEEHDAEAFTAHMLMEMARMSTEDGLVMQIHVGSYRNHNQAIFDRFGTDKGADIPITAEFTRNMRPLLNQYGSNPNLTLVLFNLDESTYARELAPIAGHYPAVKLGPPWWFHDSLNGMRRFFDRVVETAGIYNTAGFNDDTRAYPSIPARHDVWRRAACDWVAGLLVRHIVDEEDAYAMAKALAYDLAKEAYNL